MFNLARLVQMKYEKDEEERRLIATRETQVDDPVVIIAQPGASEPHSQSLNNILQPNNGQIQQANDPGNEDKINAPALALTVVLYVISISVIMYGAIHLKDCPAENMIPIAFLVIGCLMFFSRLLSIPDEYRSILNKRQDYFIGDLGEIPKVLCRTCFNLLVQLVALCFFFALCYWTFSIKPDTQEGSANYCAKEFYKNTYYGSIAGLSIFGISIFLLCCGCCCLLCRALSSD